MMRRRMILAAVPSLVAGCLGSGSNTSTGLTTTRTTATNTSTTVTDTTKQPYDLIPANPASMTENEVRQQLVDHNCVELLDLPMTCPADDGQLTASVSPTVGEIPGTTVEFTVENSADEPFETNHYDWTLQKWDGSSWRRIAPLAIPAPLDEIPPGESHTYRIMPVEDELIRSRRAYIADSGVTIGGLGPGVYGFSTQGHFESTPEDEIGAAAVFGFAGEGSPVRPTDDVTGIERNGTTLTVRADASADRRGELVVSFVDGESDTQLLSEHVRQLRVLLNVLPYAATDGIENIRYVGHADDVDIVDTYLSAVTPDGAMKYRFRDYVFELSKSEK